MTALDGGDARIMFADPSFLFSRRRLCSVWLTFGSCHNQLMVPCITCEAEPHHAEDCSVAWGNCGHSYHVSAQHTSHITWYAIGGMALVDLNS